MIEIDIEVSSWPYAGGHINGLTLPNGWSGQILINDEPWQGAALKCGDEIEVEILSTAAAVPPAVVDTEISHYAERLPVDMALAGALMALSPEERKKLHDWWVLAMPSRLHAVNVPPGMGFEFEGCILRTFPNDPPTPDIDWSDLNRELSGGSF